MTSTSSKRFRLLSLYELPTARRGVISSAKRLCANAQRMERVKERSAVEVAQGGTPGTVDVIVSEVSAGSPV